MSVGPVNGVNLAPRAAGMEGGRVVFLPAAVTPPAPSGPAEGAELEALFRSMRRTLTDLRDLLERMAGGPDA
jgi:hypothetical protein